MPGGDALEELRGEIEALRRENAELRSGLKSAKLEIKKLKERTTVSIRDSPIRDRRTAARRTNSDSDSVEEMQVDAAKEGEVSNREGALSSRALSLPLTWVC